MASKDETDNTVKEPTIDRIPNSLNGYLIVGFFRKSDTRAVIIAHDPDRIIPGYRWVVGWVSGHSLKYGEWFNNHYTGDLHEAWNMWSTLTHPSTII